MLTMWGLIAVDDDGIGVAVGVGVVGGGCGLVVVYCVCWVYCVCFMVLLVLLMMLCLTLALDCGSCYCWHHAQLSCMSSVIGVKVLLMLIWLSMLISTELFLITAASANAVTALAALQLTFSLVDDAICNYCR